MNERDMTQSGRHVSPAMADVIDTVTSCMQCGTCSASCPVGSAMDYSLRRLMLMLQQGKTQEVLASRTIWLCASCYSCTVRCPRDIPVTDVLGELRGIAIEEGFAETTGMTFTKAFLRIVAEHGRMFEPELMLRYHARQEQLSLLGATPVALALLRKGKLSFLPERLPASGGRDEVQLIFERVAKRREGAVANQTEGL